MLIALGRGGETLKFINRVSGARVNCSKDRGRSLEEKGKITITGTRKEVQSAKVRFLAYVWFRKCICVGFMHTCSE